MTQSMEPFNMTFPWLSPERGEDWYLLPTFWDQVLRQFLQMHGVWPDEKHFTVSYNSCYHSYDMDIYPHPNNRRDTAASVGKKTVKVLTMLGKKVTGDYETYRWERGEDEKKVMVRGRRIWIQAECHVK